MCPNVLECARMCHGLCSECAACLSQETPITTTSLLSPAQPCQPGTRAPQPFKNKLRLRNESSARSFLVHHEESVWKLLSLSPATSASPAQPVPRASPANPASVARPANSARGGCTKCASIGGPPNIKRLSIQSVTDRIESPLNICTPLNINICVKKLQHFVHVQYPSGGILSLQL